MSHDALKALSFMGMGELAAVFAVFCECSNDDNDNLAWPSQREVIERSGLPRRTVQRHIKQLKLGRYLIDTGKRIGNRIVIYRVAPTDWAHLKADHEAKKRARRSASGSAKGDATNYVTDDVIDGSGSAKYDATVPDQVAPNPTPGSATLALRWRHDGAAVAPGMAHGTGKEPVIESGNRNHPTSNEPKSGASSVDAAPDDDSEDMNIDPDAPMQEQIADMIDAMELRSFSSRVGIRKTAIEALHLGAIPSDIDIAYTMAVQRRGGDAHITPAYLLPILREVLHVTDKRVALYVVNAKTERGTP